MIDLGRWLYLVVTLIEVKAITALSSLRAKTGINTILPLSKNISNTTTAEMTGKKKTKSIGHVWARRFPNIVD
jgi:hypothetical protein